MDVDQHPHIGLCTFTYLFEGEVEHKDSTGAHQVIRPGDVGMMTAGSGVTHTERTPTALRSSGGYQIHGYQIWISLPLAKEEMPPRFDFVRASDLPSWACDGMKFKLLAGKAYEHESPLPIHSPLFVLDIEAIDHTTLCIAGELQGEIALLVNQGQLVSNKVQVTAGQLMVSKTEDECSVDLEKGTRLLIFGGPKLPEERYLLWNFVSSSKERLVKAKQDWINKKFPKMIDDDTYIPIPGFDLG
jgi:redox-sensitive bicupin YhaK (pirin superfamily)